MDAMGSKDQMKRSQFEKEDVSRAPLFEAMVAHHAKRPASFHVPGHKSGQGLTGDAKHFYQDVMSIDYTEITGLDDLHHPEEVIMEAEQLAAACFGAEETFFLVGGSTAGNLAMILATCAPGDLILVQRNVHKSVLHGLMLAQAKAVFIAPRVHEASGVAAGLWLEDVQEAIRLYPTAKALLLTNPNYYGMGVDLTPFAELLHANDKLLLVDEAHGAHYGFHEALPASALSQGADAVVQSTHKMLTAMTMGAMLHVQGPRIDRSAVRQMLAMLQSSSPSYPIMASLDLARRRLHMQGAAWIAQGLATVQAFRERLDATGVIGYFPQHFPVAAGESSHETADPFKITIYDKTRKLTGSQLKDRLEDQGCYVEMTDGHLVLLVFTPATSQEDMLRAAEALDNICWDIRREKQELQAPISNILKLTYYTPISSPVAFARKAGRQGAGSEDIYSEVDAQEAIGHCSADMVIPYPPGIPYLYPGEVITASSVEALIALHGHGIRFQGTDFGHTKQLRIYKPITK